MLIENKLIERGNLNLELMRSGDIRFNIGDFAGAGELYASARDGFEAMEHDGRALCDVLLTRGYNGRAVQDIAILTGKARLTLSIVREALEKTEKQLRER